MDVEVMSDDTVGSEEQLQLYLIHQPCHVCKTGEPRVHWILETTPWNIQQEIEIVVNQDNLETIAVVEIDGDRRPVFVENVKGQISKICLTAVRSVLEDGEYKLSEKSFRVCTRCKLLDDSFTLESTITGETIGECPDLESFMMQHADLDQLILDHPDIGEVSCVVDDKVYHSYRCEIKEIAINGDGSMILPHDVILEIVSPMTDPDGQLVGLYFSRHPGVGPIHQNAKIRVWEFNVLNSVGSDTTSRKYLIADKKTFKASESDEVLSHFAVHDYMSPIFVRTIAQAMFS